LDVFSFPKKRKWSWWGSFLKKGWWSACSREDYPSNSHIDKGSNLMLQLFVFNVSSSTKVSIDVASIKCVSLVAQLGPS
jgi:hypothetical protein